MLLLAAVSTAQPAGIEGIVVDRDAGQPLSGVHVRMITGVFDGGGINDTYGAISDRAGHFSLTNLKPGLYLVLLERRGFVQVRNVKRGMFWRWVDVTRSILEHW
jgi:hypothetical protein